MKTFVVAAVATLALLMCVPAQAQSTTPTTTTTTSTPAATPLPVQWNVQMIGDPASPAFASALAAAWTKAQAAVVGNVTETAFLAGQQAAVAALVAQYAAAPAPIPPVSVSVRRLVTYTSATQARASFSFSVVQLTNFLQ